MHVFSFKYRGLFVADGLSCLILGTGMAAISGMALICGLVGGDG